jgi:hypothetical protein
MTFLEQAKLVLSEAEAAIPTPNGLLSCYMQFVQWCEEGYQWDVSEFWNELSARRLIELLLRDPKTQDFPETGEFRLQVQKIDERFRALLQPEVEIPKGEHWWEKGVLRRAGAPYVNYFKDAYNIKVDLA